jgi:hypothetical protein
MGLSKFPSPEPHTLGPGLPTPVESVAHARGVEAKRRNAADIVPLVGDVRMRACRAPMAIGDVKSCLSALPRSMISFNRLI